MCDAGRCSVVLGGMVGVLCGIGIFALPTGPARGADENKPVSMHQAQKLVKQWAPKVMPAHGKVPAGFMLSFTDPGCDPGQDCDDVGPWNTIRRTFIDESGCNTGEIGIGWGDTEPGAPVNGKRTYDFSGIHPDPWQLKQKHVICYLDHFNNPWANKFRFTDIPRYNKDLEAWAQAACAYIRKTYGITLFEAGGNERDLVAPSSYKPYYPDWYQFYVDPVAAIYRGMKEANPENKLIAGNLCYSDRTHIKCLYLPTGKRIFDILAIHAYGGYKTHVDMEQILDSHEEMAAHGDGGVPIILTEGWSSLPLPGSIGNDPRWHGGARAYTPAEVEYYRQSVLDGWRNLTTPRPGYYNPKWVIGAHYFVLNDHWGGRGWAKRAKPQYDENGKLKGFLLDGYSIGTTDPNAMQPVLRPWGLIDINGKPKGDTVYAFPPYIPKQEFTATLAEKLDEIRYDARQTWTCPEVVAGRTYHVTIELTNQEQEPITECSFSLAEPSDKDSPHGYAFAFVQGQLRTNVQPDTEHLVHAKLVSPPPPSTIAHGQSVRLSYDITFDPKLDQTDGGVRKRVRPTCDLYYLWKGRPYHDDAWLPRVAVRKAEP